MNESGRQPARQAIPMADLAARYDQVFAALRERYGSAVERYLGPGQREDLQRLEVQLQNEPAVWQDVIRARAQGVLYYVYYWSLMGTESLQALPRTVTPALHVTGIEAQWRFLQAVAEAAGYSKDFRLADVRGRLFELQRAPLPAALKAESRAYTAAGGKFKYGSLLYYQLERYRLRVFCLPGRVAAIRAIDELEMHLLRAVLIQPEAANIQPQTA